VHLCLYLFNIAEGTGKTSTVDEQRFYAIARGSAMECGAIYDVCQILGIIEHDLYKKGKNFLKRIVSMLSKMCGY